MLVALEACALLIAFAIDLIASDDKDARKRVRSISRFISAVVEQRRARETAPP